MLLDRFNHGGSERPPPHPNKQRVSQHQKTELRRSCSDQTRPIADKGCNCFKTPYTGQAFVACDGYWEHGSPLPFLAVDSCAAPILALPKNLNARLLTMTIGTVKFFNADKGFGFIAPEGGGDDAFVHISAVERAGMTTLEKEQRVSYDLEQDQRGKTSATNLAAA